MDEGVLAAEPAEMLSDASGRKKPHWFLKQTYEVVHRLGQYRISWTGIVSGLPTLSNPEEK